MPDRRLINFAGSLACVGLLAYAFYAQFHLNLEPCPLCIFQRIAVLALGIAFLLAALHNPRGRGGWIYVALIAVAALGAIGVAARHVYIQSQPPGTFAACGAPLNVMLQMFHVWDVVRKVLHAGGECAVINWTFLGLTMPAWVLIWAAVLGGGGIAVNVPRRPPGLRLR